MNGDRYLAVDRIETDKVVLLDDDEQEYEVSRADLPLPVEEGAVLRVEFRYGGPLWASARLDVKEQERRLRAAQQRMDELRKQDPGGDLKL